MSLRAKKVAILESRLGARLEFRDYVSRFKGIDGRERNSTRNDVMLVGAMTLRI